MSNTVARAVLGRGGADQVIAPDEQEKLLAEALGAWGFAGGRVLLLAPDFTRFHSGAGALSAMLYNLLSAGSQVDLLPTLGSHVPMNDEELGIMYPGIPPSRILIHNWRTEVRKLGEVPAQYIEDLSEGKLSYPVSVEVNRHLVEGRYDLILSLGQVVPHEVIGMANHIKNILVGIGGKDMLDKTHYLGAVYNMERIMGRIDTPVRRVMDYAAAAHLADYPIKYIQTVMGPGEGGKSVMRGLYLGEGKTPFFQAARLAQQVNLNLLERPIRKAVVWLDPAEFKTTWLGNKAIYRTRMAMADGGELLILAPGLRQFGEDLGIDALIRKYGYRGTPYTLDMVERNADLQANLSAAAHLIHGSAEGRFRITYAPGHLTREETEAAGFNYAALAPLLEKYDPGRMADGNNEVDGEEVFFVRNPGQGLWALRANFPD